MIDDYLLWQDFAENEEHIESDVRVTVECVRLGVVILVSVVPPI